MSIKEHPPQDVINNDDLHVPVLLDATLDQLDPKENETYLDLTAGYGGHASRILSKTNNYHGAVLVDRDDNAIARLVSFQSQGTRLMHTDFLAAARSLKEEGASFDMILVDLGVSSPQLDQGERGFSFTKQGPLDMRMDQTSDVTAEILVNMASRDELIRIIITYGEELRGFTHRIVDAIIASRPLKNTTELADLIKQNYRGPWKKTHPATRTFQALRIAVNDELRQVEELMPLLPSLLNKDGRVGVISFHSLEDRIVKQYFNEQRYAGYEAELTIQTKKVIDGGLHDVHNPRSRSAKLRVAVKK